MDQPTTQHAKQRHWQKLTRKSELSTVGTAALVKHARRDVSQLEANSSNILTATISYYRSNLSFRLPVYDDSATVPSPMEKRASTLTATTRPMWRGSGPGSTYPKCSLHSYSPGGGVHQPRFIGGM